MYSPTANCCRPGKIFEKNRRIIFFISYLVNVGNLFRPNFTNIFRAIWPKETCFATITTTIIPADSSQSLHPNRTLCGLFLTSHIIVIGYHLQNTHVQFWNSQSHDFHWWKGNTGACGLSMLGKIIWCSTCKKHFLQTWNTRTPVHQLRACAVFNQVGRVYELYYAYC